MTMVLSLFLLAVGVAVILNVVMRPTPWTQQFPRYGAPARWDPRIVPLAVGSLIVVGGVALLLLSRGASS